MARTLRYHPNVADDLSLATTHFDRISAKLGNRFRASFRRIITVISARPASFGRLGDQLRAATLERFPYVVVFESDEETVTVIGLFHTASDDKTWRLRKP